MPGVSFVAPNDISALEEAVGDDTALVLLEPILGEGGVVPLEPRLRRGRGGARRPALLRRDPGRHGSDRVLLRIRAARREAGPRDDGEGARERAADRGAARGGRLGGRLRPRRPRLDVRRQPRRVRGRLRRRGRDRRGVARRTSSSREPRLPPASGSFPECSRCAVGASCSALSSKARPGRSWMRAATAACSCSARATMWSGSRRRSSSTRMTLRKRWESSRTCLERLHKVLIFCIL